MIIAMHGDPGSGKDAVGRYLVEEHGFTRLAFADKLKKMCEALDPIVGFRQDRQLEIQYSTGAPLSVRPIRLAEAVAELGWDEAKKQYSEVRRTQQRLATEVIRNHVDPDFWVNYVFNQIRFYKTTNYVITDLRFPNEGRAVRKYDGQIWWITRKNNPYGGLGVNAGHVSERWHPEDYVPILNDGTLEDLHAQIEYALNLVDVEG